MIDRQPSNNLDNFSVLKKDASIRFNDITNRLTQLFPESLRNECNNIEWTKIRLELTTPRYGATESVGPKNSVILHFSDELLTKRKELLYSVLWREAFLLYLPDAVRLVPEAADLGLFCYYKYGLRQTKQRQRFLQIWETVSPIKEYIFYRYHPSVGFRFFDRTVDGNFLRLALNWLSPFNQIPSSLTSDMYTANLEQWMFNYHRILKPVELKVLQGLNICPTCNQKELATKLDLRQPTISRVIKTLAEKHLLRLIVFHNPTVLGLQPIAVTFPISKISTFEKLKRFLFQIRYLSTIREFEGQLLIVFLIPSRRVNRFRQWLKQLVAVWELSTPTTNFVIERSVTHNLRLYDPGNQGWPKDYSSIIENLARILNEDWTQQLPQIRSFQLSGPNVKTVELEPEDFTFIERATDVFLLTAGPRFSEAQEARIAGYNYSEHMAYRRRVDFLQKHQLISKPLGIGIFHIGLDASINLLLRSTVEESRKILTAFQIFPYVGGLILDDGSLGLTLLIPQAFAVDVEKSLRNLLTNFANQIHTAIQPAWQSFGQLFSLPINSMNYNFHKGSWVWTKDTLPQIKLC
jgi:hypothetical protein